MSSQWVPNSFLKEPQVQVSLLRAAEVRADGRQHRGGWGSTSLSPGREQTFSFSAFFLPSGRPQWRYKRTVSCVFGSVKYAEMKPDSRKTFLRLCLPFGSPLRHVSLGTQASKDCNWWSESEPRWTQWRLYKNVQHVGIHDFQCGGNIYCQIF